jgi:hypothetical protein
VCRDWVGFQKVIEEAADAFGHVCSRAVKARMHLGMLHAALLHVVFWTLAFWSGGGAGRGFWLIGLSGLLCFGCLLVSGFGSV